MKIAIFQNLEKIDEAIFQSNYASYEKKLTD